MLRLGRNKKSVIILTASNDVTLRDCFQAITGLSVLYKTAVTNEKNLFSTITSVPSQKIIVVLMSEEGLKNREFRQGITTCIAAKLTMIVVRNHTRERMLSFFPCISQKRYEQLDSLLERGILYDDVNQVLSLIVTRINEFHKDKGPAKVLRDTKLLPNQIALSKRLLIKPMNLKPAELKNHSCNLLSRIGISANELRETPECKYNDKMISGNRIFNYVKMNSQKNIEILPENNIPKGIKKKTKLKPKYSNSNPSIHAASVKHNCPIIEISSESEHTGKDVLIVPELKLSELSVSVSGKPLDTMKRFSFDYISKRYLVYDPSKRKDEVTTCIDFPIILSRENSELTSSIEDYNLELLCIEDPFLVIESPIPSPIFIKDNLKYRNPLPVFPEQKYFPPVGLFPCDDLQIRRPSLFDVLNVKEKLPKLF